MTEYLDEDGNPESNVTIADAIISDHETGSELSRSDSESDDIQIDDNLSEEDSITSELRQKYFYEKKNTDPTQNVRMPAQNILK